VGKNKTITNLKIEKMVAELTKREKEQDRILGTTREIIRHCSNSIKMMHAGELKNAKAELSQIEKKLCPIAKTKVFDYLLTQTYQEVAEAHLLLAAIERRELPGFEELGMPFEPYLLGMCDFVGELRRQMLECLKVGKKKEAGYYFDMMNAIYDELVPIRFSNSLLPNFRKKQDVARHQVEQARSEIVHAGR
jgi:translin